MDRLKEYETLGAKIDEIEILKISLEKLNKKVEAKGMKVEELREVLAETLIVELSKKEWDTPEAKEAIQKEINNMKNYGVFGERIKGRLGIEIVGTRLILTKSQLE